MAAPSRAELNAGKRPMRAEPRVESELIQGKGIRDDLEFDQPEPAVMHTDLNREDNDSASGSDDGNPKANTTNTTTNNNDTGDSNDEQPVEKKERPALPESTRILMETGGVPKRIMNVPQVFAMLSEFKKAFGSVLTASLLSAKTSSGAVSARSTMSSSTVEFIRLAPQLKVLELRLKDVSRQVSAAGSRQLSIHASNLLQSFRAFFFSIRRYQETSDDSLVDGIKARGVETKEATKELAAQIRIWQEEKAIVRSKLETKKLQQAQQAGKTTQTSVVKLDDIFRCAKEVANSLNKMPLDHSLSDPKLIYRAALARQTFILRFAALGRNFAARFPFFRESNMMLIEISSAIVLASGRLHSTETSLIDRAQGQDLSSALQSALMGVQQMVQQFVMTCVDLVQHIKLNKAARQQKKTSVWDEVPLKNSKQIQEVTFNQLLRVLIDFKAGGTVKYGKTFFRTYRALCSPEYLLKKFFECWQVPEVHQQNEQEFRTGVLACLKEWLSMCPADFSPSMIDELIRFDQSTSTTEEASLIGEILRTLTLDAQAARSLDLSDVVKLSMPEQEASNYFDGLSEKFFAEQLTIVDFSLFSRIQPAECLEACWSKESTRYLAHNLIRAIQHFGFVQSFTVSSILGVPSLARRAARLCKLIRAAIHLFQLKNYAGASAIDSAISEQAIKRLKYTFAEVPPALLAEWRQISAQLSDQNHYAQLKQLMKTNSPPLIPPLGLFLSELIQIEDRYKLYNERGLVNFTKCELVATIIQQMQDYQSTGFTFTRDTLFISALRSFKLIDADQLYAISSEREPRSAQKADLVP